MTTVFSRHICQQSLVRTLEVHTHMHVWGISHGLWISFAHESCTGFLRLCDKWGPVCEIFHDIIFNLIKSKFFFLLVQYWGHCLWGSFGKPSPCEQAQRYFQVFVAHYCFTSFDTLIISIFFFFLFLSQRWSPAVAAECLALHRRLESSVLTELLISPKHKRTSN